MLVVHSHHRRPVRPFSANTRSCLIRIFEGLDDLHPQRRPPPAGLPDQANPHLIRPRQPAHRGHSRMFDLSAEPPFFQAVWSATEAFGFCGRGTFFFSRNRENTCRIPHGVYAMPY